LTNVQETDKEQKLHSTHPPERHAVSKFIQKRKAPNKNKIISIPALPARY
jgi:hypothetical protein